MSVIGIDVGTSGCKAALFSGDGNVLAHAYREYATLYPYEGHAELDANEVWGKVQSILREVATQSTSDPVRALCVSSMGEAATPVSHSQGIIGNSILSSDCRGAQYTKHIEHTFGQEAFYRINPNILASSYTMPKLAWIRDNEPTLYQSTDCFLLWDGLVGYLLGADPFISFSSANRTLLFDIEKETWSDKLLGITGIDISKLPPCVPSGQTVGYVNDTMAQKLGLPMGVAIISGGHDQCCNALGAGIASSGSAVDGIGTYECITPVFNRIPDQIALLKTGLNIEHHVVPGLYVSFLFNQAGVLIRWFRDTFAPELARDPEAYDKLTAQMPPNPTNLFVLPYFQPTGSPGYVSNSAGVIAGLKMHTTRAEVMKAFMESITYYFTESIGNLNKLGIDTSEFVATGGGSKSDAWLQIKADIFGVPFRRLKYAECGLVGTAILAAIAVGEFGTIEQGIENFVTTDRIFDPDTARHRSYQERVQHYNTLFPLMKDFLSSL